ncbi:TPA: hypothetical protein DCW61_01605 [Candidatus Uhrbacteria bacterium]|nr:hypothetical protein [Candidatus Uhrbacteria bacterium]
MHSQNKTVLKLREAVERKAYAYGISPIVSTLLGEYVIELITHSYARHTEKLVSKPLRSHSSTGGTI